MEQKPLQVVNFNTRDFRASIDIDHLIKVVALPQLLMAPEAPDFVIGLMNVAGDVVPVIDLSMRLQVSEPKRYEINTPILICRTSSGETIGVIVAEVMDIATINNDMLADHVDVGAKQKIITGAIKYSEGMSLLINVDHLLN